MTPLSSNLLYFNCCGLENDHISNFPGRSERVAPSPVIWYQAALQALQTVAPADIWSVLHLQSPDDSSVSQKNAASVFCRPWEKCSCYMQWKRNQEEFVGFVNFSSMGKKGLGHIIHAIYLISLISSVRATDKCRFDTRIWVFLDPLPETMVLLLLQMLFEIWDM